MNAETVENEEISSYRVDHLGLVAQMIEDIGIVDIIDSQVGYHPNEIITTGQATAAIITMALGFVSRPMYLSPQFFESKALSIILGNSKTKRTEKFLPEHFNDDKLGRTLDIIYDLNPETLFQTIALAAIRKENVTIPTMHIDTTSHSFYGNYEEAVANDEPLHAKIEYGFSKDSRDDCKQLVQELIVSSDGDVPLMTKIHAGNASDSKIMQERIKELKEQFKDSKDLMPEYIVADSKFYCDNNINKCQGANNPYWITRVPDQVTNVQECYAEAYKNENQWIPLDQKNKTERDKYQAFEVVYAGVLQRYIVVISDASYNRAAKTIQRKIKCEFESIKKELSKLSKKEFLCEADARVVADDLFKKTKFHKISKIDISSENHFKERGRPKANSEATKKFHISLEFKEICKEEIDYIIAKTAYYVIGTNNLKDSPERIISIYRNDQQSVERGFRFLKNPSYFADAFFFKNTKRIIALITLMTLSLLVYSLLQRRLRIAIEKNNTSIPNQVGKPTKTPTMNWVNQCFEGIDVIYHRESKKITWIFVRFKDLHKKILALLGPQYVRRYSKSLLE